MNGPGRQNPGPFSLENVAMTASLWDAQFEYWINLLSEPGKPITRGMLEDIGQLLSKRERLEANDRADQLEAEMVEELDGLGQPQTSELSDTLRTLIRNVGTMKRIHQYRADKAFHEYEEQMRFIIDAAVKAQQFYDALPPDEQRFWTAPMVDEDGNWCGSPPQVVDKWTALRPDLVSPRP